MQLLVRMHNLVDDVTTINYLLIKVQAKGFILIIPPKAFMFIMTNHLKHQKQKKSFYGWYPQSISKYFSIENLVIRKKTSTLA